MPAEAYLCAFLFGALVLAPLLGFLFGFFNPIGYLGVPPWRVPDGKEGSSVSTDLAVTAEGCRAREVLLLAGQPCSSREPHGQHEWYTPAFRRDCPGRDA